jgi:hypothetical protein
MPKLSKVAGFEWARAYISSVPPGESARLLREAMVLGSAEIARSRRACPRRKTEDDDENEGDDESQFRERSHDLCSLENRLTFHSRVTSIFLVMRE